MYESGYWGCLEDLQVATIWWVIYSAPSISRAAVPHFSLFYLSLINIYDPSLRVMAIWDSGYLLNVSIFSKRDY